MGDEIVLETIENGLQTGKAYYRLESNLPGGESPMSIVWLWGSDQTVLNMNEWVLFYYAHVLV